MAKDSEIFVNDIERFAEQAKGAVEVYVIRQGDPKMLEGLVAGDKKAMRFWELLGKFVYSLSRPHLWAHPKGPCCLTCERKLAVTPGDHPAALAIQAPWGTDWEHEPATMVVSGVCKPCCSKLSDDEIAHAALAQWPDCTEIPDAGNA